MIQTFPLKSGRVCRSTTLSRGLEQLEDRCFLSVDHVIHISVDGLSGMPLEELVENELQEEAGEYANFARLHKEGGYTYNARTDFYRTLTLPNHTSMLTGRPVLKPDAAIDPIHHNWTMNSDPQPGQTLHSNHPDVEYIASVFDVVHDHGLSTAMFASKTKFSVYSSSYNAANGAPDVDPEGQDNGRNKIDFVNLVTATSQLADSFIRQMGTERYSYSFLHFADPDTVGHQSGWESEEWLESVQQIDQYLGRVFELIESDRQLRNNTAIVLTSDHGGSRRGHSAPEVPAHFTIPFFVWGDEFEPESDLYRVFQNTASNPGSGRPNYDAANQPIRNGDSGNLSLALLGLDPIPGSTINNLDLSQAVFQVEQPLTARDDRFVVEKDSDGNELNVLANDSPNDSGLFIESVERSSIGATIEVIANGGLIVYDPPPGFTGNDRFSYTVSNDSGDTATARVDVIIEGTQNSQRLAFLFDAIDGNGQPVENLAVGASFDFSVSVQDQRPQPSGVRKAYLDVDFTEAFIRPNSSLQHGSTYRRFAAGEVSAGKIDEGGGEAAAFRLDGREYQLLELEFQTIAAGHVEFDGNAADEAFHDIMFFDSLDDVNPRDILFEPLEFRSFAIHNSNNPLDTNEDGNVVPQDALLVINYLNSVGSPSFEFSVPDELVPQGLIDVNNDRHISPFDALLIINHLNSASRQAVFAVKQSDLAARLNETENEPVRKFPPSQQSEKQPVQRPRQIDLS